MTRYKNFMQQVHNQAIAHDIEWAAARLTEDVIDLLIKTGVRPGSPILNKIKELQKYEYSGSILSSNNKHQEAREC